MPVRLAPINHHGGGLYGYEFVCPGCEAFVKAKNLPPEIEDVRLMATHVIPTTGPHAWGFNGNLERPTFTPSILVHEVKHEDGTLYSPRCHSFVTDGRIQFLGDCGHSLAGQTVELPEL